MSNQLTLTIEELGAQGDGIAHLDGQKVYVPLTLPGEVVRVSLKGKQGDGLAAKATEILSPSDDRVDPSCKHFTQCGGCALQHLRTPAYLDFKEQVVAQVMARRGFNDVSVEPPLAFPAHTRRRVTLAAMKNRQGVVLGFHQKRGNQLVNITECTIAVPEIVAMFDPLRDLLGDILPGGGKATIAMTVTEKGVDMLIDAGMPLDLPLREALASFALQVDVARLTWKLKDDEEPVIVLRTPIVTFHQTKITLPTSVFLQASAPSEAALIDYVRREVGGASQIADLFSGCGTFSYPLAAQAKVDAFDIDIEMVEAARRALPKGQDAPRLVSNRRDLFKEPLTVSELAHYDAVVLDPPRAGAKTQCRELAKSEVPDIVMVSCNPATFSRDARTLVDGGYVMDSVQPIDQFLWSAHIELVASFYRD
ncbi:MAG: 23S rRNA (uracil(1939)-C(5))-methyltransferase RlmD [Alphaproteobacteria bacterium]|nr:MAG: 23S rRNA (uracil(1939)-C(5))-methyltransferase RlmD [Alphaproteobacteria bacterium]